MFAYARQKTVDDEDLKLYGIYKKKLKKEFFKIPLWIYTFINYPQTHRKFVKFREQWKLKKEAYENYAIVLNGVGPGGGSRVRLHLVEYAPECRKI